MLRGEVRRLITRSVMATLDGAGAFIPGLTCGARLREYDEVMDQQQQQTPPFR
jgi:hypothetical protein